MFDIDTNEGEQVEIVINKKNSKIAFIRKRAYLTNEYVEKYAGKVVEG